MQTAAISKYQQTTRAESNLQQTTKSQQTAMTDHALITCRARQFLFQSADNAADNAVP
jgi:hypothetical protein